MNFCIIPWRNTTTISIYIIKLNQFHLQVRFCSIFHKSFFKRKKKWKKDNGTQCHCVWFWVYCLCFSFRINTEKSATYLCHGLHMNLVVETRGDGIKRIHHLCESILWPLFTAPQFIMKELTGWICVYRLQIPSSTYSYYSNNCYCLWKCVLSCMRNLFRNTIPPIAYGFI